MEFELSASEPFAKKGEILMDQRFQVMADAAPMLVWLANDRQEFTWFNRGWLNYTGRELAQELGKGWLGGVHRDDVEAGLDAMKDAFATRRSFTVEYRLRNRAGEYRWILNSGGPLF